MLINPILYQKHKHYDWDILRYDDELWGLDLRFWFLIFIFFIINIIIATTLILVYSIDYYFYIVYVEQEKDNYLFIYEYDPEII